MNKSITYRLVPVLIISIMMLAGFTFPVEGASQGIRISRTGNPSIMGVYSSFDTNGYLQLVPMAFSSGKDLSVVSGMARLQEYDKVSTSGFLALFPSSSFTKFKMIFTEKSKPPYTTVYSPDVEVVLRKSGSGGIGDIAAPPSTEVWLLQQSTFWISIPLVAYSIAALDSNGEEICQNSFTLEKLKAGRSNGFTSSGSSLAHDGDKAYVIASINNRDDYYANNPVIIASFDGKCKLIEHTSFRIATSPESRVYINDAVYSNGYIYASGIYNSGAQEATPKMLVLKISAKTLGIMDSKAIIIPGTEDMSTYRTVLDAGSGIVALSAFYSSSEAPDKLATIALDSSTMQPFWATTATFPGIEGRGIASSVKLIDGLVLTIGSIYTGASYSNPETSKGFITAHITDTGVLGAAYTLGVEGSIVFSDMASSGDEVMIAAEWIPGALDAGLKEADTVSSPIEKDGLTLIDLPRSGATQPIKSAEEITGGLTISDVTSMLKTGYSNMKDHSLYITTLKVTLEEGETSTKTETMTEATTQASQQTTSQTTEPIATEQTSQPTTTEESANTGQGDKMKQYISGTPREVLVAIAIILLAIIIIAIRR